MKESHPVEVAEFAKARDIADATVFVWWVPYTLWKRDVILSAVKSSKDYPDKSKKSAPPIEEE
jgi:hypothetical protein